MPDVLGFDQRNVEIGLNLLQKVGGPQSRVAPAYDRDVSGGVRFKGGGATAARSRPSHHNEGLATC